MDQLNLFDTAIELPKTDLDLIHNVHGLNYLENFITDAEHKQLVDSIDTEIWLSDLKRRVQHYGFKYDYKKRSINYDMYIGQLPSWSEFITSRLVERKLIQETPNQIIVNEYLPGQGIANHIDCEPCFGNTIISLSLVSACVMEITNKVNRNDKIELLLQPRSLIMLSDNARYDWMHGIPSRKSDTVKGIVIPRKRRISLTFRKVIL